MKRDEFSKAQIIVEEMDHLTSAMKQLLESDKLFTYKRAEHHDCVGLGLERDFTFPLMLTEDIHVAVVQAAIDQLHCRLQHLELELCKL